MNMNLVKARTKSITIAYFLLMFSVAINVFLMPNYLMAQIFGLIFITLTYMFFSESLIKFIYYITILFSFIDFGLLMPLSNRFGIYYFYITMFIYYLIYIRNYIRNDYKINLKKLLLNKYIKFVLIFSIYMISGIFFVKSKKDLIKSAYVYLVMFAYLIMFVIENKKIEDLKETFKFIGINLIGILALGLLKILGFNMVIRNVYSDMGYTENVIPFLHRMPIVFSYNPNNYAVLIVITMVCIGVKIYGTNDNKDKIFFSILFIISQINLIFSMSRTAWITIFLIFIFALLISFISKDIHLRKTVMGCILILICVFLFFSVLPNMDLYYGKFNDLPIINKLNIFNSKKIPNVTIKESVSIGGSGSLNERTTLMYDVAKGVFLKGHVLGFGAGNTMGYIKTLSNTNGIYNIHSLWFEILGDFGIPIFLYYVYIYMSIIIVLFKKYIRFTDTIFKMYMVGGVLCLFGFIFLSFAPSSVLSYVPYWLLMGISCSLVININSEER